MSTNSATSGAGTSRLVHFAMSFATLLSGSSTGNLADCQNATDPTCSAGIAAVNAYWRTLNDTNHHDGIFSRTDDTNATVTATATNLLIPRVDLYSPFVQMHPNGWSTNRIILHDYFGYRVMVAPTALITNSESTSATASTWTSTISMMNDTDVDTSTTATTASNSIDNNNDKISSENGTATTTLQQRVDRLQTSSFPLLMTNIALSMANSWEPFTVPIYFDDSTRLAVMSVVPEEDQGGSVGVIVSQIDATRGALDYIARINAMEQAQQEQEANIEDASYEPWIPVVIFTQLSASTFMKFLTALVEYEYPPALVLDVEGNVMDLYPIPTLISSNTTTTSTDDGNNTTTITTMRPSTWVCSYNGNEEELHRFQLEITTFTDMKNIFSNNNVDEATTTISTNFWVVTNVSLIVNDLTQLPNETFASSNSTEDSTLSIMESQYAQDILFLRQMADEAFRNDPVVGQSLFMPVTRNEDDYRACMGGECPLGNLFTDALRWYVPQSDIAFITSGGIRGPGWKAGPVRVSNIWAALPFTNSICTGTMLGLHVYELLNFSTSQATFKSTFTDTGDQLLQVSGLRYIYNTEFNASSRLVRIDIYNSTMDTYIPLERLQLYNFVTDSYLCGIAQPWSTLLSNLNLRGERPGTIQSDTSTLLSTHQLVVAAYLESEHSVLPYNTTMQGRLQNDTTATVSLNLIQTKAECQRTGTQWDATIESCIACPNNNDSGDSNDNTTARNEKVLFTTDQIEFTLELGTDLSLQTLKKDVVLINLDSMSIRVVPKLVPEWIQWVINSNTTTSTTSSSYDSNSTSASSTATTPTITLESGQSVIISIQVTESPTIDPGSALGSIAFGIVQVGSASNSFSQVCVSKDVTMEILVRIIPENNMNQLGGFRYIGFTLAGIIGILSLFFSIWVAIHRKERIFRTLQPVFLITISLGVFVIGCSLISLSIDDQILPAHKVPCMATPWLMALGATLAFSSLFSKLWRINKLFNRSLKRVQVTEKDVLWPFGIMLGVNLPLLLVWTFVDPLVWERAAIEGQPWSTYGACSVEGTVSTVMAWMLVGVNSLALILACWQAYLARTISDEFSEAKYIGIAVYSWFQVLTVGFPVLFLIDSSETQTSYFVEVAIISIICLSMLFLIFVPLVVQRCTKQDARRRNTGVVRISGVGNTNRESQRTINARESMAVGNQNSTSSAAALNSARMAREVMELQARITELEANSVAMEDENEYLKRLIQTTEKSPIHGNSTTTGNSVNLSSTSSNDDADALLNNKDSATDSCSSSKNTSSESSVVASASCDTGATTTPLSLDEELGNSLQ